MRKTALAAIGAAALVGAGPAHADFRIDSFTASVTRADGQNETQAGKVPDAATTQFDMHTTVPTDVDEHVRNVTLDLPPGFIGNPTIAPQCSGQALANLTCPVESQVGVVRVRHAVSPDGIVQIGPFPVYNMVPRRGEPARFGFPLKQNINVAIDIGVRSATDYGVTATLTDVSESLNITGSTVTLWGVPADATHDAERAQPQSCNSQSCTYGATSSAPRLAFLRNPTACPGTAPTTTLRVASWEGSTVSQPATPPPPPTDGCGSLAFAPTLTAQPDTAQADSPAGFTFDLKVPQGDDPAALATPDLEKAVVTLPPGVTVNPSSADGLSACSLADIALHSLAGPSCPGSSKIGTVSVTTPLLSDPLEGSVYLAAQNDNPFGSVLAIYVVAEGQGVILKLPGRVDADPGTGQLTATFDQNPQLPFTELKLAFKGGPRAPLATPDGCGTYTTTSTMTPYSAPFSGPAAGTTDAFEIGSGCDGGFSPSFVAGATNTKAGQDTGFTLQLGRADGQQHFKTITTTLPPGLLAKVASVPLCADADATAGSCGPASQIGTTTVSAGPGSQPFFLGGSVYLTGPYKSAPYGLSIVVRALAGPYDLGTVVVRAALDVDRHDAHVTVTSDEIPNVLVARGADGQPAGFPLRVRSIQVDVDRPGFMVNPTSCAPMKVGTDAGSWEGAVTPLSTRFQIGGCQALAFSPKIKMTLKGKGQTKDGKHPILDTVVTQTPAEAHIGKVAVALPLSLALDPENSQVVCTVADAAAVNCPAKTRIGTAVANTPLLPHPLKGNVYLVQGIRTNASGRQVRTLPKLLVPLHGDVDLDLQAQTSVASNKLVTTFAAVPDAQISRFELTIAGGRHGILVVTHNQDLCKAKQVTAVKSTGQNAKAHNFDVTMKTPCATKRSARSSVKKKPAKKKAPAKKAGRSARWHVLAR
jgi:hypothetical protein